MLTRPHYKAIAEIFRFNRENIEGALNTMDLEECIARDLVEYFAEDNPRFNRSQFMTACGLEV